MIGVSIPSKWVHVFPDQRKRKIRLNFCLFSWGAGSGWGERLSRLSGGGKRPWWSKGVVSQAFL